MGRLSEFKSALAPLQTEQCEPPVKTHTRTHPHIHAQAHRPTHTQLKADVHSTRRAYSRATLCAGASQRRKLVRVYRYISSVFKRTEGQQTLWK